jgi:hypothetical protein
MTRLPYADAGGPRAARVLAQSPRTAPREEQRRCGALDVRPYEKSALAADFIALLSEPSVSVWLFVLSLRTCELRQNCCNFGTWAGDRLLRMATRVGDRHSVYSAYRRDMAAAERGRDRVVECWKPERK